MFLGHFAVGFASKKAAPRASLLPLMAAALLPDLLWPLFLALGWEEVAVAPGDTAFTPLRFVRYPVSHSLLADLGWALLFALAYYAATRYFRGAWIAGLGVVSHWLLDALSHRADLPLYPGGARVGLGLWNSVPETLVLESLMFLAGVALYARATRPRDRAGVYGFWGLIGSLALLYVANAGGPPPPGVRALILVSIAAWALPLWAGWADRHRAARKLAGP